MITKKEKYRPPNLLSYKRKDININKLKLDTINFTNIPNFSNIVYPKNIKFSSDTDKFIYCFENFNIVNTYMQNNNVINSNKLFVKYLARLISEHYLTKKIYEDTSDDYNFYDLILWLLCFTGDSITKNPYAIYFSDPFNNNINMYQDLYDIRYILTNYIYPKNLNNVCFNIGNLEQNINKYQNQFSNSKSEFS